MKWTIDIAHSSIEFGVKHLGIATVKGRFLTFEAGIETGPDGMPTLIEAKIDASSVDTNNPQRDDHIRSADILDVAQYPEILYRSSTINPSTPGETHPHRFDIAGELTLHGVTKLVHFSADVTDPITDPWGKNRVAAEVSGQIARTEFGIHLSNLPLVNNILMIGEEISFQFHLQATEEPATP